MFFYEGLSCPHCSHAFSQTDDIVACPVCGAPHHRACWTENDGCACAADHGTDRQWSRRAAVDGACEEASRDVQRCPSCGTENSPFAELCAHCGCTLSAREWGASHANTAQQHSPFQGSYNEYSPCHAPQSPCGGLPADVLIEGETAGDLATVVRFNAPYYLKRFQKMADSGNRMSWNWAAFLIPGYWLLYRKQYVAGAVYLLFDLLYITVMNLVSMVYFSSAMEMTDYAAVMDEMMRLMQENERVYLAAALVGMLAMAMLFLRLSAGLFGNRLYMKGCLKTIRHTRHEYPEGYQAQLSIVGGTSLALAVIGYMAMQLLPSFLLMLFI